MVAIWEATVYSRPTVKDSMLHHHDSNLCTQKHRGVILEVPKIIPYSAVASACFHAAQEKPVPVAVCQNTGTIIDGYSTFGVCFGSRKREHWMVCSVGCRVCHGSIHRRTSTTC